MIITQEMIDTVRPYSQMEEQYKLVLPQQRVHKFLGDNWDIEFFTNYREGPYISLSSPTIGVEVFRYNEVTTPFTAYARFNDQLTVEQLVKVGKDAELVVGNKDWLIKEILSLQPMLQDFMHRQEIIRLVRSCFSDIESLYHEFTHEGQVDTEKALTHLWKQDREVWSQIIYLSMDGKPGSFKRIRTLIDRFYQCYQDILSLQEKQPA